MSYGNGNSGSHDNAARALLGAIAHIDGNSIIIHLPQNHPLSNAQVMELLQVYCDLRDRMISTTDPRYYARH